MIAINKTTLNEIRKNGRGRAGTAILEFALGASVLLSAFAGTFQFGYTFYIYNNLATSVHNAARHASLRAYDSSSSTPSSGYESAVKNMVVYGNPAGTGSAIAPGLATSNVNLTVSFTSGVPSGVTITVNGYQIDSAFSKITCNNKPKVSYPYIGIFSPPTT